MRRITLLAALFVSSVAAAQEALIPDSLVQDFSTLVNHVKQTHPDPYTSFGGKLSFHLKADQIKNALAQSGATKTDLIMLANGFLAQIQDGHTAINPPDNSDKNKKNIQGHIAFGAIEQGVILQRAASKDLLGAQLVSINGVSVDSLVRLIGAAKSCENRYGAYAILTSYQMPLVMRQLFGAADQLTFRVNVRKGRTRTFSLPFNESKQQIQTPFVEVPTTEVVPDLANNYIGYGFAKGSKDIMVFQIKSLMARENFDFCLRNKWSGAYQGLESHYKWTMNRTIPADTAAALAGVPSFSELFAAMLIEMKNNGSKNLIIDLRGNPGGWTPIAQPSLYMMYGMEYLKKDMGTKYYKLLSPLVLQKENQTLESYSKSYGRQVAMGDYLYSNPSAETQTDDQVIERFISSSLCSVPQALSKDGTAIYTPKNVYVLTDEKTFSAAFHYAFYLWKMGAKVVGVTSSQAPNTYMETTPFRLPYTGLSGSISNAVQLFFPLDDPRARLFTPDIIPLYKDYAQTDFDTNGALIYLINRIKKGK